MRTSSIVCVVVGIVAILFPNTFAATVVKTLNQLTAKADRAYEAGNSDAAITEYNRVLALNLTPAQASVALMRRGNCYEAKHDLERAIADYDQALRLDPKNAAAYDNRAIALEARGDRDDAIKDYNEALRLTPRNATAYLNRAGLFLEDGDLSRALDDYTKALTINGQLAEAHCGRADIYLWREQPSKALVEADAAIAADAHAICGYSSRAHAYVALGRYVDAQTDVEKALKVKTYDPTLAFSALAWFRATCPDAHFRNGKQALEAARKRCQPSNYFNYFCLDLLAVAYAEVGDFDQAVSYETQALEKAPPHGPRFLKMKKRIELFKQHQPYREETNSRTAQDRQSH